MPTDDVSDLRDVVDAINRLCETMKTSDYVEPERHETREDVVVEDICDVLVEPKEVVVNEVETYVAELWSDASSAWVDSIEAVSNSFPIQTEVIETVADNPPAQVVDNIVNVTSSQMENLETVTSNRSNLDENVVIMSTNQSLTKVEKVESVAIDSSISQSVNVETVSLNLPVTRVENPNVFTTTNKVETIRTTQSSIQIENVESILSDRSPTRPDDIRTVVSDPDLLTMSCEPASEMYYTASSEVSLLSDFEMPDRIPQEESLDRETVTRDNRDGVMAGHVAAMRERFESMTRTNTPCPDLMRSVSPSLDVYRNITPSPDHLG